VSEVVERSSYEDVDPYDSYGRGGLILDKPDYEALCRARERMEEIAAQRERDAYETAMTSVEMRRLALEARRPPTALSR
jgi:hypothetical protein